AGILQAPFFDPNADDAVNYGAIGGVTGCGCGWR
ncbi:MAG: Peptidase family, partial [Pseudomonadota bacterium]